MVLFLKNKPVINSLFVLSGMVLGLALTCENAPTNIEFENTGGIYGFLRVKSTTQTLPPTLATVFIEGTNVFAKPDSTGIFYFPEVKPGQYTLIGRAPGFADYIVTSVEVSADSVSVLPNVMSLTNQSFIQKEEWKGMKIKKIGVRRKGSMMGRTYDSTSDEHVANANVIIHGTMWGARCDSSGNFLIKDILPGKYKASSSNISYHRTVIYAIRIAPDSISIVDFRLTPSPIPEEPLPTEWEEKFVKQP